ncbi:MAG: YidC/Oxa1 family membrane protein insertase [Egibacteraceae bacterium]
MGLWDGLIQGLSGFLRLLHDGSVGVFGVYAWGWAIILLTFAVRLLLLPLAVKQTNSMRAMQKLQPELKKVQTKYRTDRSMMRTNPEKYRARKQKQQEAMMALYKEHNVNPAASCLPLLLQMPIFFALYRVLIKAQELRTAPFYFIPNLASTPGQGLAVAGIGAFVLLVLMGATTFYSTYQMQARTPVSGELQAQQQKILLYVMPVMLTFVAFQLPAGVLLYWVATNLWTMGQQYLMFRNIEPGGVPAVQGSGKR